MGSTDVEVKVEAEGEMMEDEEYGGGDERDEHDGSTGHHHHHHDIWNSGEIIILFRIAEWVVVCSSLPHVLPCVVFIFP